MKCAVCTCEFDEDDARHACSGCVKSGGCVRIKCPRCGYEVPPEPRWIKRLRRFINREEK